MNLTLTIKTLLTILIAFGLSITFIIPVEAQRNVTKGWCHNTEYDVNHETGYVVQNKRNFYYTDESRCSDANKVSEEVVVNNVGAVIKLIITTNFLHPIFELLISGNTEELSNLLTHIDNHSKEIVRDYIGRKKESRSSIYIPLLTDELIYKFDGVLGFETIQQHQKAVKLSASCHNYDHHITNIVEDGRSDCPEPTVELTVDVISREDGTPRPLSEDEGTFRGSSTAYTFTLSDDFSGTSNLWYEVSAEDSCQTERRITATTITENQATEIETRGGINVCFWVETEDGVTDSATWEIPVVEVEEAPEETPVEVTPAEEETITEDEEEEEEVETSDDDSEPLTL